MINLHNALAPVPEQTSINHTVNPGYGFVEMVQLVSNRLWSAWQQLWGAEGKTLSKKVSPIESIYPHKRMIAQAGSFPAAFDLNALDGTNGFRVEGLASDDTLGYSVSSAGDLNGDGKADLILGARGVSTSSNLNAGTAYILFGKTNDWPASFNLSSLDGSNGFKAEGLAEGDLLGYSVSSAGDLNGDGKADLLIGAPGASPSNLTDAGTVYVLFGQSDGFPASFDLTKLNGVNGFKIEGLSAGDYLGAAISTAGDLNGDGKAEFLLGSYKVSSGNRTNVGAAYVIFGQANSWPAIFDLNTLDGINGFKVDGLAENDRLGLAVSSAGDLNGDGKGELVLGAPGTHPAGTAYVIFGQTNGWPSHFNLSSLDGTNGFKLEGLSAGDSLGYSVSTAGDLNGDGKSELLLGASGADPGGRVQAGTAYVIFGSIKDWPASFNLSTLNGTNGFKIEGLTSNVAFGFVSNSAGDINGDGRDDFLLSAQWSSPGGLRLAGTAYVIFGQAFGWETSFDLTSLDGTNGFRIEGLAANDLLGFSLNTAGDLNGDGRADLVVGAPQASPGGRLFAGTAYVIFGNSPARASLAPTLNSNTVGIAVGVTGLVLLGGLAAVIIVLKQKKKVCFASRSQGDSSTVQMKAFA